MLEADGLHTEKEKIEEMIPLLRSPGVIAAVGSGTITDFGRYSANTLGVPFVSIPTLVSADGYSANICSIIIDGQKKSIPMVLNIFNSQNRSYMLRYYRDRLRGCVHGFAVIVSEGKNIDWADLEYVVDFYVNGVVGLISMWLDNNMELPPEYTQERLMQMLEGSVEEMLAKFQKD